jgi:uncharacterized membrane-anchored protein
MVKASWSAVLTSGAVRARVAARKTLETPTVVVHNLIEEVLVTQRGEQQLVHVIATNAFVKTAAGWKMVLHHGSAVPSGQAVDLEERAGTLH